MKITIPTTETAHIVIYPDGRLDTRNAALYIGYSVKTLAMKRCEGSGPKFVKLGYVYYYREDLDAWIAEQGRQTSTAQGGSKRKLNIIVSPQNI